MNVLRIIVCWGVQVERAYTKAHNADNFVMPNRHYYSPLRPRSVVSSMQITKDEILIFGAEPFVHHRTSFRRGVNWRAESGPITRSSVFFEEVARQRLRIDYALHDFAASALAFVPVKKLASRLLSGTTKVLGVVVHYVQPPYPSGRSTTIFNIRCAKSVNSELLHV